MGSKRYANLNSYPVILPTSRGGQRVFRSGEFTTESWFSRFQGNGQLTEVDDSYTPAKVRKPKSLATKRPVNFNSPVTPPRVGPCALSCQTACQNSCELACESTKQNIVVHANYEQIGDTFLCRHCDWSTQKPERVAAHMQHYHPDAESGPEQEQGSANTTDPAGGPRASGASAPRPSVGRSAVPPQAPASLGSLDDVDENTKWWYRRNGELFCKTCEVVGHGWKTSHMDAMLRHCVKYHEMPEEEAKIPEPPVPAPDPETVVEEPGAAGWKCKDCGRSFKTKGGLSTHSRYCKGNSEE